MTEAIGAFATIEFDNQDADEGVLIIFGRWDEKSNDDDIFFWLAGGEEELKKLMKPDNGKDFVILSYRLEH